MNNVQKMHIPFTSMYDFNKNWETMKPVAIPGHTMPCPVFPSGHLGGFWTVWVPTCFRIALRRVFNLRLTKSSGCCPFGTSSSPALERRDKYDYVTYIIIIINNHWLQVIRRRKSEYTEREQTCIILLFENAVTCSDLQPLAAACSCSHLQPLAATCGCLGNWLQVAASGCKWLQVAASGCKGRQVVASGCL